MATAPHQNLVRELEAQIEELRLELESQLRRLDELRRKAANLSATSGEAPTPGTRDATAFASLRGSVISQGDLVAPTGEHWDAES